MFKYILNDIIILEKELRLYKKCRLEEESEQYIIEKSKKHQINDKLTRDILNDKSEVVKIINRYLKPEEELNIKDIEKYDTKYINGEYQNREADIVYKLKEKEVFFLIEHQTKIDKLMAFRILEYSFEIIRTRLRNYIQNKKENKKKSEEIEIPEIIPIVIYTGKRKWNAKTNIEELQVEYKLKNGTGRIIGYNLLDIRDKEKAIKDDLLISKISILNKANSEEEICQILDKIDKNAKDNTYRKKLAKIIKYLLTGQIEEEKIKEFIIKFNENEEGGDFMLEHAFEVLERDRKKAIRKGKIEGKREGKKEGIREGKKEGIKEGKVNAFKEVAKNMLKEKVDIDFISKVTGLKKEDFIE